MLLGESGLVMEALLHAKEILTYLLAMGKH